MTQPNRKPIFDEWPSAILAEEATSQSIDPEPQIETEPDTDLSSDDDFIFVLPDLDDSTEVPPAPALANTEPFLEFASETQQEDLTPTFSDNGEQQSNFASEPSAEAFAETELPWADAFVKSLDDSSAEDVGGLHEDGKSNETAHEHTAEEFDANRAFSSLPASPSSSVPFLPLIDLQQERHRLMRDLEGIRSEIERHREALLELIDLRGRLAEQTDAFKAVGEQFDIEDDTPNLRALLPRVRALLAETETRSLPAITTQRRANEAPVRRLISMQSDGRESGESQPAQSRAKDNPIVSDLLIPIKWWHLPIVATLAVVGCLVPFWLNIEVTRTALAKAELKDAIEQRPINYPQLERMLAVTTSNVVARFDATSEYSLARAADLISAQQSPDEILSARKRVDPVVMRRVERAVERAPTEVWPRVTLAKLQGISEPSQAAEPWKIVESLDISDALYWETLGDYWRSAGRTQEAIQAFKQAATMRPETTRPLLSRLREVRVELADALEIVPTTAGAALDAVEFIRNEEGRKDWQTYAERLLARLPAPDNQDADELGALGQLQAMLGMEEEASSVLLTALTIQPQRNDLRLRLAKLCYLRKQYAEADDHAARVVRADPTGTFGDEARSIRNKIELIHSGKRNGPTELKP